MHQGFPMLHLPAGDRSLLKGAGFRTVDCLVMTEFRIVMSSVCPFSKVAAAHPYPAQTTDQVLRAPRLRDSLIPLEENPMLKCPAPLLSSSWQSQKPGSGLPYRPVLCFFHKYCFCIHYEAGSIPCWPPGQGLFFSLPRPPNSALHWSPFCVPKQDALRNF